MTELAVIDNAEVALLNKTQAKALDKKVRSTSDRVQKNLDKAQEEFDSLVELLAEAAEGEIHQALGLKSWTVWVKDAVNIHISDREERRNVVSMLTGKGLSTRAIGSMLGVDKHTVTNDLAASGEESPVSETTGLDGRTYKRKPKEQEQEPIDAEVVDEGEPEPPAESKPPTAAELVDDFHIETANLWNACASLKDLLAEENWSKARKRATKADANDIQLVIEELNTIIDDLMTSES